VAEVEELVPVGTLNPASIHKSRDSLRPIIRGGLHAQQPRYRAVRKKNLDGMVI